MNSLFENTKPKEALLQADKAFSEAFILETADILGARLVSLFRGVEITD